MFSDLVYFVLTTIQTSWVTSTTWECLKETMPLLQERSLKIYSDIKIPAFSRPSYVESSSIGPADLLIISRNISEISIRPPHGGRVIIVTSTKLDIEYFWTKYRLLNVLVLVNNESYCDSYSWFPYKTCPDVQVVPIKTWKPKLAKISADQLFPAKLGHNLGGCDFYTFGELCFPYNNRYPNISHSGADVHVIDTLLKYVNLTKVELPLNHTPYVNTDADGNLINAPKLLSENKLDLYYGCQTIKMDLFGRVDFLPSHYEETIEWFFPTAKKKPLITGLYSGLRPQVWIGIVTTYLTFTVYLYIANLRQDCKISLTACFFLTFASILNTASRYPPRNNLIRISMAIYYLFSIHIAAFYQTCLLQNLYLIPKESPYTDAIDGFNRGLHTILRYTQRAYFNATNHGLWNKILTHNKHTITLYIDYHRVVEEQSAMFLGIKNVDRSILYYTYPRFQMKEMVQSYQKPFLNYPLIFMIPLGHPLKKLLSVALPRLVEGGLTEKWRKDSMASFSKFDDNIEIEDDVLLAAIDLNRLQSLFYLYGCLSILSVVVFLCEMKIGSKKLN